MGFSPQFALRGSADKQGAISSMIPPQRCPRSRGTETGSSKALGCAETPAESGWGIPGERGSIHLWLSSLGSLTPILPMPANLQQSRSQGSSVPSKGHEDRLWAGLCLWED